MSDHRTPCNPPARPHYTVCLTTGLVTPVVLMVIRLPEILAMYMTFQSPANTRDSTINTQEEQTDKIDTHIRNYATSLVRGEKEELSATTSRLRRHTREWPQINQRDREELQYNVRETYKTKDFTRRYRIVEFRRIKQIRQRVNISIRETKRESGKSVGVWTSTKVGDRNNINIFGIYIRRSLKNIYRG